MRSSGTALFVEEAIVKEQTLNIQYKREQPGYRLDSLHPATDKSMFASPNRR